MQTLCRSSKFNTCQVHASRWVIRWFCQKKPFRRFSGQVTTCRSCSLHWSRYHQSLPWQRHQVCSSCIHDFTPITAMILVERSSTKTSGIRCLVIHQTLWTGSEESTRCCWRAGGVGGTSCLPGSASRARQSRRGSVGLSSLISYWLKPGVWIPGKIQRSQLTCNHLSVVVIRSMVRTLIVWRDLLWLLSKLHKPWAA